MISLLINRHDGIITPYTYMSESPSKPTIAMVVIDWRYKFFGVIEYHAGPYVETLVLHSAIFQLHQRKHDS